MKRKTIKWWADELGIKTKAEVEEKIRAIVSVYPDDEPIGGDDLQFLTTVLQHHYQWAGKVGCGIKAIVVRTNRTHSNVTRGFWVVRADDSSIDISWVVALQPEGKPAQKNYVTTAARYEVHPQIHSHHKSGDCGDCPVCGVMMVRGSGLHVDHEIPFDTILQDFMTGEMLGYDDIEIEDLGLDSQFADGNLAQRWYDYHLQHAKLRLVHSHCNLARGRTE